MKYILILLIVIGLCSCHVSNTIYKPTKPFVITWKGDYFGNNYDKCNYKYYDKGGNIYYFEENSSKYNLGDTIK